MQIKNESIKILQEFIFEDLNRRLCEFINSNLTSLQTEQILHREEDKQFNPKPKIPSSSDKRNKIKTHKNKLNRNPREGKEQLRVLQRRNDQ